MDEMGKRVTVAIRIRPKIMSATNATQTAERYHSDACTKVGDSSLRLADTSAPGMGGTGMGGVSGESTNNMMSKEGRMNSFSFDYVFDQDSSQLEVYEETTLDAVDCALSAGCNATIMTYGQTGSGKTYTVLGAVGSNPLSTDVVTPNTGLFLRVLKDVLSYAEARANDIHVVVGLTVTEVYLDIVRDLLSPKTVGGEPPTLKVIMVGEDTFIPEVTTRPINEVRDAVSAYKTATNRRVSRATEANDASSRSHAIFSIDIFQQRRLPEVNPHPMTLEELCVLRDTPPTPKGKAPGGAAAPLRRPSADASTLKPDLLKKTQSSASLKPTPISPSSPPPQSLPPKTPNSPSEIQSQSSFIGSPAASEPGSPKLMPPIDVSLASNPVLRVGNGQPPVVYSKIVLTDLAGSEKMKHSKAKGEALEEMKKINGSLTALGNVVHSLFSGSKHVPYRDAKLTIMLKTSFSTANSRIVLIANCAPTALTYDETLSTMFFADKVKAMKVDEASGASGARAAEALRLEAELLKTAKEQEELAAEMRILRAAFLDHRPCIRAGLLRLPQSPEALGMFRPAVAARLPSTPAFAKQAKVAIKEIEEAFHADMKEKKLADQTQFEQQLENERELILTNTVTTFRDSVTRAKEYIKANTESTKAMVAELDKTAATLKADIEETEGTLSKGETEKDVFADKGRKLTTSLAAAAEEDTELSSKLAELERIYMEKYKDQQDEWDRHTTEFTTAEALHSRQKEFFNGNVSYLNSRAAFFEGATEVEAMRIEAKDAQKESELFDVSYWVRGALMVMANNAVIRSQNALRKAPVFRPMASADSSLSVVSPKLPPPKISQPVRAPSTRPNGSHVDPQQQMIGGVSFGSPLGTGPPQPPRPAPRQLAPQPQKAANTPFDQPSLALQIKGYMETGCTLLMYGKKGSPHFRFFFVETTAANPTPRLYWCRDDSERPTAAAEGSFLELSSVTRITIGKTPELFPSLARIESDSNKQPATDDDDYYTSFVVHYLRDRHEPKTLCLTTESKAEMEAWVIGLCGACQVNPEYGEKLGLKEANQKAGLGAASPSPVRAEGAKHAMAAPSMPPPPAISKPIMGEDGSALSRALLDGPAYHHLAMYLQSDLEIKLCEQWHVPPKVWLGCKVRLQMMATKIGKVADESNNKPLIQLTPGEVRQLFPQLDIFRANAVWEVLAQIALIDRNPDSISYLLYASE